MQCELYNTEEGCHEPHSKLYIVVHPIQPVCNADHIMILCEECIDTLILCDYISVDTPIFEIGPQIQK